MGYYNGSGVTTSGGKSVSVHESFVWYGAHNIYQMHDTTTVSYRGVSLATAKSKAGGTISMSAHQFVWSNGAFYHWSPNCKGSQTSVSYSQIGDSNLYEVHVTTDVIKAKLDDGGWV